MVHACQSFGGSEGHLAWERGSFVAHRDEQLPGKKCGTRELRVVLLPDSQRDVSIDNLARLRDVEPFSEETSVLPRANRREQPIMPFGLRPVSWALLAARL